MLDVLGLIARTCWVARNKLVLTCRAFSAPVDPAVFAHRTVTDDLIETLLPNGIRHGLRVRRAGYPAMMVADYYCGQMQEMISYTPLHDGPIPSVSEFIAAGYDRKTWTRHIEWVYRRVRFTFADGGWGRMPTPLLDMRWSHNDRTQGRTICGRSLTIRAAAPTNTETVTRDEVIAWAEAAGYMPMDADEICLSECVDLAR